tara:strand:- start:439 stop:657 length:219 start_codon:yes stop_codon:yes gene_type:complete
MKQVCINFQECTYHFYIDPEDISSISKFSQCPECNALIVLVTDDTNIEELLETPTVSVLPLKMFSKSKKKET